MQRRDFLRTSMGTGLAVAGVAGPLVKYCAGAQQAEEEARQQVPVQSEDGVVIHSSGYDVMRGSPPADNKVVTLGNYEDSRVHQSWAAQYMRELCPTQLISCGRGSVAVLPRKPRDIDDMELTDLQGKSLTVSQFLAKSYTEAFLVLHQGHIVTEQYYSGMTPDAPHRLYSVSKPLLANVVAALADEGVLSLGSSVPDYVHELSDTAYSGATLRHLLDMQSGVKYEYALNDPAKAMTEHARHYRAAGLYPRLPDEDLQSGQYNFLLSLKVAARQHGMVYSYKCADTIALMWACERVTGRRYADLLSQYVWSKLGAENDASIVCDVKGAATPFGGMSTTLRDLARWGQMHLEEGMFRNQRILPERFIRDTRENADPHKITNDSFPPPDFHLPGCAYRNQYFRLEGAHGPFYAAGARGQYCYIHPSCDTVIAKFSTNTGVDIELGKLELHAFRQIAERIARDS